MNKKIIGAFTLAAMLGVTACNGDRDDTFVDEPAEEPAPAPTIEDDPLYDDPAMRDTLPRDDEWEDDEWDDDLDDTEDF